MTLYSIAQSTDIIEMVDSHDPHQFQHNEHTLIPDLSLPIVMYSEKPSAETVLEMHEDDVPAHEHHEEPSDGIEITLDDLPGVEALDPDLEQALDVNDTVSSNETMRASDMAPAADGKKSKKDAKWDWEARLAAEGSHGFISWIKERLETVPSHSGYDTSGIERAISYLERLDNEISKAMRLDLDGKLDADKIEEVRSEIDDGIERLHARADKVTAKKGKGKKKKADDQESGLVKEAQKAAGIGPSGIVVTCPLIVSHVARVCVNGMVSSGFDIEEMVKEQCKKFEFTKREQAELIELLFAMNVPMRINRGYMPDEDIDSTQGNYDWMSQYQG